MRETQASSAARSAVPAGFAVGTETLERFSPRPHPRGEGLGAQEKEVCAGSRCVCVSGGWYVVARRRRDSTSAPRALRGRGAFPEDKPAKAKCAGFSLLPPAWGPPPGALLGAGPCPAGSSPLPGMAHRLQALGSLCGFYASALLIRDTDEAVYSVAALLWVFGLREGSGNFPHALPEEDLLTCYWMFSCRLGLPFVTYSFCTLKHFLDHWVFSIRCIGNVFSKSVAYLFTLLWCFRHVEVLVSL